jgi:hypothetical protein
MKLYKCSRWLGLYSSLIPETQMDEPKSNYLQIEETQSNILNQFLCNVFWVEFGTELELKWVLLLYILAHHLKCRT